MRVSVSIGAYLIFGLTIILLDRTDGTIIVCVVFQISTNAVWPTNATNCTELASIYTLRLENLDTSVNARLVMSVMGSYAQVCTVHTIYQGMTYVG